MVVALDHAEYSSRQRVLATLIQGYLSRGLCVTLTNCPDCSVLMTLDGESLRPSVYDVGRRIRVQGKTVGQQSPTFIGSFFAMVAFLDLQARAKSWLQDEQDDEGCHLDMDVAQMLEAASDPTVCYNALDLSDIDAPVPDIVR